MIVSNLHAQLYLEAAQKLKLKVNVLDPRGFIEISGNKKQLLIFRAVTSLNTAITVQLCKSKNLTHDLLVAHGLPSPTQLIITNLQNLHDLRDQLPIPGVVKPANGLGGQDVFTNLNFSQIMDFSQLLLKKHPKVLVESFVPGDDYRLLVFGQEVIGAIKKTPPRITGDGQSTIEQLIKQLPRSEAMPLDEEMKTTIANQERALDTVLAKDQVVDIRGNANYSTGGTTLAIPVNSLHHSIREAAVKATEIVKGSLIGVDLRIQDPNQPIENNASIIELNNNPGIGTHHQPDSGEPQLVADYILKKYFELV